MIFKFSKSTPYLNHSSRNVYKDLTAVYLDCLSENDIDVRSGKEISELLRYSLCRILNLRTKEATVFIKEYYSKVEPSLRKVLQEYDILNEDISYKQGVVESCVHAIELTRQRANL